MIESGAGVDLEALPDELAEKSWGGSAAVAMARPASSNRFRRVRDAAWLTAEPLPGSSSIYVFSPAAVRQADFSRRSQAQRTGPRGMTVRYDENAYLKIVLIFLQAGDAEKLSQAEAAKIRVARVTRWMRADSRRELTPLGILM